MADERPIIGDELIAERRGGVPGVLPDDMNAIHRFLITWIDRFANLTGKIVCLLVIPIMFAMVYEVIARKFFIAPTMWAFDISRMLYGAMFMLGAGYALMRGVHIRADFLYRGFSERTQGRVDFALYLLLFFPAMLLFFWSVQDFALAAIMRNERASDTAWAPIVWPLKSALAVGVLFLIIQGISEILKAWYAATRGRWPQ